MTPGDVAELREGLVRVVSGGFEPDLRAGRETVEREFDVADSAARLRELIATAVTGPHRTNVQQVRRHPLSVF